METNKFMNNGAQRNILDLLPLQINIKTWSYVSHYIRCLTNLSQVDAQENFWPITREGVSNRAAYVQSRSATSEPLSAPSCGHFYFKAQQQRSGRAQLRLTAQLWREEASRSTIRRIGRPPRLPGKLRTARNTSSEGTEACGSFSWVETRQASKTWFQLCFEECLKRTCV